MRVLVAEDEPMLAELVADALREHAMAVDVVGEGATALALLATNDYDVLVLDRELPRVHGDQVCRSAVSSGARTRILMLTAANHVADLIAGLNLGADDYLGKPFDYGELVARVLALGRRAAPALPPVIRRGDLVIDVPRRQAFRNGRLLPLSLKEFAVLQVIASAEGAVVSAEELLERAWDANIDPFSNVVRVTISKLRAKLGKPAVIETVAGAGYRM